jgi:hypothetical protein
MEQIRDILQRFCDSRAARVQISEADACRLQEAWSDRDAEGICLHTLLQAGLTFADSGMHHARRLADQFRSFWTCCTQGAGQTLAGASATAAKPRKSDHFLLTLSAPRGVAASDDDRKLLSGKSTDEAGLGRSSNNDVGRKECGKRKVAEKTKQAGTRKRKQEQPPREANSSKGSKLDAAVPLRRVRQKTAPDFLKEDTTYGGVPAEGPGRKLIEAEAADIYFLRLWKPSQGNQDPRAVHDAAKHEAAALLSDKPTLPQRFSAACDPGKAYDLPNFHCAFRDCTYECATEQELAEHISDQHAHALRAVSLNWLPQASARKATFQAYQEVLTWRCQQLAPIANCSLDRRCLRRLRTNLLGEQVGAAICFVCARRFPFAQGFPNQQIARQRA